MRCKVLKPKGSVVLRYASSAKNPFDEQTSRVLSQGFPQVLLEFSVVMTNPSSYEVHYDVTRMVALSEHLRKPIDGESLREMLDQMKTLLDTCAAMHLPLMNVVFDVNQVYYDSWSRMVRFVYLPFGGIVPDAKKIQAFFTGLSSKVRPADATAQQLIATYDAYVRAQAAFDPTALCSFLGGIGAKTSLSSGGPAHAAASAHESKVPAGAGSLAGRAIRDRPASAAHARSANPVSDGTTVLADLDAADVPADEKAAMRNDMQAQDDVRGRHASLDPGTSVLDGLTWESVSEEERAAICGEPELTPRPTFEPKPGPAIALADTVVEETPRQPLDPQDGTTVLHEEDASLQTVCDVQEDVGGQPLFCDEIDRAERPLERGSRFWLTHLRSGDRVELVGNRFVVGKSKYSTYQVRGTTTVSRSHALFCCERDGCWIEDDDSKNGTFVNGQSLAPHARRRLHDGDVIRMSDENFAFVEERAGA